MARSRAQWSCTCGKTFRSYGAEARHRHNFPVMCWSKETSYRFSAIGGRHVSIKTRNGLKAAERRASNILCRRTGLPLSTDWKLVLVPTKEKKWMPTTRAYCWASGLIEFTDGKVPDGGIPFAYGPEKALRALIEPTCRHGYKTGPDKEGRPTKVPGSECLLVPGVPEAKDQHEALRELQAYCAWIRKSAPSGVTIL